MTANSAVSRARPRAQMNAPAGADDPPPAQTRELFRRGWEHGHTRTSNRALLKLRAFSGAAVKVYLAIASYEYGQATFYQSMSDTARLAGVSVATVRRERAQLRDAGLLAFQTSAGRRRATTYQLPKKDGAPWREKGGEDATFSREKGSALATFSREEKVARMAGQEEEGEAQKKKEKTTKKATASSSTPSATARRGREADPDLETLWTKIETLSNDPDLSPWEQGWVGGQRAKRKRGYARWSDLEAETLRRLYDERIVEGRSHGGNDHLTFRKGEDRRQYEADVRASLAQSEAQREREQREQEQREREDDLGRDKSDGREGAPVGARGGVVPDEHPEDQVAALGRAASPRGRNRSPLGGGPESPAPRAHEDDVDHQRPAPAAAATTDRHDRHAPVVTYADPDWIRIVVTDAAVAHYEANCKPRIARRGR